MSRRLNFLSVMRGGEIQSFVSNQRHLSMYKHQSYNCYWNHHWAYTIQRDLCPLHLYDGTYTSGSSVVSAGGAEAIGVPVKGVETEIFQPATILISPTASFISWVASPAVLPLID
mmetsp:Transcript_11579/g.17798  ORF Transcript_11579/g.17798 Transcript_11579/m.17798 type:complete len:115 (+) Transcript_11579:253-597(+)